MRTPYFLMFFLTTIFAGCSQKAVVVNDIVLDDIWKFKTGDSANWAEGGYNDAGWKTISITKSWEDQGYTDYDGFAWYRKTLVVPDSLKEMILKYGGIIIRYANADDADEFYFNGTHIGTTGSMPPAYSSKYGKKREYLVPSEYISFDKPNLMAIRVYDGVGGGGVITPAVSIRPLTVCDKIDYRYDVPAKEWVFAEGDEQKINLTFKNTINEKTGFNFIVVVKTDDHQKVDSIVKRYKIDALDSLVTSIPLKLNNPGFYQCTLFIEKEGVTDSPEVFTVGFEPEKIVSPTDAKEDFDAFWNQTREELNKIEPQFKMNLLKDRSTGEKNIYHVEMMSFGKVKVEGFYAVPKKPGKYPAIAYYMGYGSEPWYPDTNGDQGFASFVMSVRGQGIQKATNTYGDWIVWGLESKENYYYRGAFMDLVRAIDFLVSRPEVDADKIVAEGGSQGGAFTLAACALDNRIKAGAPTVPFLSDYRDYFKIVGWPRSSFETYLAANKESNWDKIYDVLTYFDIKNLAGKITCPVYMAAGLQDDVCPPHTNFAAYNQIKSDKNYEIYHDQGHSTPSEWNELRMKFYKKVLGL